MSKNKGVLFFREENGEPKWFENGDEDNDGKYLGEWKKSQIWNSSYYDKNGNIIGKFVNGEWIKQ